MSSSSSRIDFGTPQLRLQGRGLSLRIPVRTQVVIGALTVLVIGIVLFSLATGAYPVPLGQVISTLVGRGHGLDRVVVLDWRLPEILLAGLFGSALGVSGAIFQSLTRNPLGSPDIIGLNTGAYTGALIIMLVLHSSGLYSVTVGAIAGGLLTAVGVYVLAYRRGVQGFRLIVAGIGVTAMLTSVNTWLLLRADTTQAIQASVWGVGSISNATYSEVVIALIAFIVLMPAAAALGRGMRALELGDDAARAHGVNAERVRLALVVVGTALGGSVTALAGPIVFVSLSAPQIAKRLTRSAGVTLGASAATGAALLLASAWLADNALSQAQPIGLVTVTLGGAYFVWLLIAEGRRR